MKNLPELPQPFQDAFVAAQARAELELATRTERFPNHPNLAQSALHPLLLIHKVFFAYCAEARNACRHGKWTAGQVSLAVGTAWPEICDFYAVRENGVATEERKVALRTGIWASLSLDARWKNHLSELAALAETGAKDQRTSECLKEATAENQLTEGQAGAEGNAEPKQSEVTHVKPAGESESRVPRPRRGRTSDRSERQKAVDDYIEEIFAKTGKRISRTSIWKSVGYKSRTEFERWERNDPRATKTAHQRFSKILSEKPHLK